MTGSWPPSTTTSTCRSRWRSCARSCARRSPADERRWLILDADLVLGLDLDRVWTQAVTTPPQDATIPADASALLAARDEARVAKDFARADALRVELAGMGWDVIDGPAGSRLTRRGLDPSD